jgi:HSP20 family molecular chaperone IbpA
MVVELRTGEVVIEGERRKGSEQGVEPHQQELSFGMFRRHVRLPSGAHPQTVRASLESGVLSVEFDMGSRASRQNAPQRITIAEKDRTGSAA